jgi:four helix bundle protein
VLDAIERRDLDLGKQLRRAASSVVLNVYEGAGVSGGHRMRRYKTALGSARETVGCLRLAVAWRYVETVDPNVLRLLDIVIGTLVRVTR